MAKAPDVPERVRELAAQLAAPTPMRRGSFTERYVKCHKPGCRCAEDPAARHGPYASLTRGVGGQTRSRWLTAEQGQALWQALDNQRLNRTVVQGGRQRDCCPAILIGWSVHYFCSSDGTCCEQPIVPVVHSKDSVRLSTRSSYWLKQYPAIPSLRVRSCAGGLAGLTVGRPQHPSARSSQQPEMLHS